MKYNRIKVDCGFCQKELLMVLSRLKHTKSGHLFCNKSCRMKWQNIPWVGSRRYKYDCSNCGIEVTKTKGRNSWWKNKFCGNKCYQQFKKGANHWHWKGGVTEERTSAMQTDKYRSWRLSVFERDGFKCVNCGDDRGGNLQADHIQPWSLYPLLRYEISNGRTLCKLCHIKIGWRGSHIKQRGILECL